MRVFFFWEPAGGLSMDRANPYAALLARALVAHDVHLEMGAYAFERGWLEEMRSTHEVLHLHWLHHFYRADDLETTVARYAQFVENLNFARSLGYRIVWTMHNLYPHERPFPEVDRMARFLVCRLADGVVAHCEYAAGLARKLFFRTEGLYVIPHGNFIDAFPNTVSRADARRELGLSEDAFVYLFFGNARTYKGIEDLVAAFKRAARPDAALVLMMRRSVNPEYTRSIEALTRGDGRIRVHTSPFFPNEAFQTYMNAADAAVLPFSEVLTSGSAITGLSFGLPVVLPRLGCLPELIDDTMGILYDPKDPQGLDRALEAARKMNPADAGRAALARAKELHWEGIAERLAAVYRP